MAERGNKILHILDRWAGIPLCLVTSLFRKIPFHKPPDKVEKMAILCLGAIGDLLLLNGLIFAIHRKFPRIKIDLILSPSNYQASFLLPNINCSTVFSIKRPDQIIIYLRKHKYDMLIDSGQWARLGAIISNCSAAKYTIGFKSRNQWRHFGYDCQVQHKSHIHEKDNFMALGQCLWKDLEFEYSLNIPESDAPYEKNTYICIHMWPSGILSQLKEWPEEHWKDLCSVLLEAGFILLLTGSEEDRKKNEIFISRYFRSARNIHSLAGKSDLQETAAVIKNARALISVNTGIMHLGALAGTPVIGLHGATNPLRWGPVGPKAIALLPDRGQRAYLDFGFEYPLNAENSLQYITVEEVLKALRKLEIIK